MTPSESLKPKHDWRWPLINTLLPVIGRAAIKLGAWPDRQIALTAGEVIRASGGTAYRESGTYRPVDADVVLPARRRGALARQARTA